MISQIKKKADYDANHLADYMIRRKAVLEVFDKFLDADKKGKYNLEKDLHNLIFPLGLTTKDEYSYENHNLWILDERFVSYKFIASDKPLNSIFKTENKSKIRPDLICVDCHPSKDDNNNENSLFDNPISFGDRSSGEINSVVFFEFKRPGSTAHNKRYRDYKWEFSELIEPYIMYFLFPGEGKIVTNIRGNQVILKETTPKFGYIILDQTSKDLVRYNIKVKQWETTPFGTYFKILSKVNLHLEVITFRQLLEFSKQRHSPFFNKLFRSSNP